MGKKSKQKKLKKKFQQRLSEALVAANKQPTTDNKVDGKRLMVDSGDKQQLVNPKIVRQEVGLVILLVSIIIALIIIFLLADRQTDIVSKIAGWLSRLAHFY